MAVLCVTAGLPRRITSDRVRGILRGLFDFVALAAPHNFLQCPLDDSLAYLGVLCDGLQQFNRSHSDSRFGRMSSNFNHSVDDGVRLQWKAESDQVVNPSDGSLNRGTVIVALAILEEQFSQRFKRSLIEMFAHCGMQGYRAFWGGHFGKQVGGDA
jgi:hypothetical protein